jgi:hypothetical protein
MMLQHTRFEVLASLLVVTVALSSSAIGAEVPSSASLEQHLREKFKPSPRSGDGNIIRDQGTALIVQKAGIAGVPMGPAAFLPTNYKDGRLHPPSVVARAIIPGVDPTVMSLPVGERVNLVKFGMNVKADTITFVVVSLDVRAAVVFHFPKGSLRSAEASQVDDVIGQVFSIDTSARNIPTQPSRMREGGTEAPMAEPPPPPPPPPDQAVTKTIEQGQTSEQVIAALGQPVKVVKLGAKEIYFYKDLKVTFTDGKVTNVE